MDDLSHFGSDLRVMIIGASGGIGTALTKRLCAHDQIAFIYAISRSGKVFDHEKVIALRADITHEKSLIEASNALKNEGPFDMIVIASGLLHSENLSPEKSLRNISFEALEQSFRANCFGPAMAAKYFMPLMHRERRAVFAVLSARVSSISDNRLGGWHAYRASKAALNMILKNISIEYARRHKHLIVVGLHPGTVDTALSEPFQRNVPEDKLFAPDYCAQKLLKVLNTAKFPDSGNLIAWDGQTIPF